MSALPPSIQRFVNILARENRPMEFTELVEAHKKESGASKSPGTFRCLKKRGLIENTVPGYQNAYEPFTGPRVPKYVLTEEGKRHVTES